MTDPDNLRCACLTHLPHSVCDEECECWGGVRRVVVSTRGRYADVTARIMLAQQ
jgi:hypothetical protein